MATYEIEWMARDEAVITLTDRDWLFRRRVRKFHGWSTVWYNLTTTERCSINMDSRLSNIWSHEKFLRDNPGYISV